MGDLIQFIPRSRRPDTDFPAIPFKVPVAPENAHERAILDTAPSEYCAPEKDPA